jgi:hypothetical protein
VTWCWLALDATTDGFRTWPKSRERPADDAVRVDARLVAGGGAATWVSWCRFSHGESLAFDDGMVGAALRRRLAAPAWPEAVSTLLVDWSRIGGAITTAVDERSLDDDPFARVFPRRIVRVEAGTFGPIPAPTGPGITRYGSGNPWPWDVYAGQTS